MSLLKIFKALDSKKMKKKADDFLEKLDKKEKAVKKLLKRDLPKSVAKELKEDLKSIKKLKEEIKKKQK